VTVANDYNRPITNTVPQPLHPNTPIPTPEPTFMTTAARKRAVELLYHNCFEAALATFTSTLGLNPDQVDQQALQAATATLLIAMGKDRDLMNGHLQAVAKDDVEAFREEVAVAIGGDDIPLPPEAPPEVDEGQDLPF
jgi:hypothetical protein